MGNWIFQSEVKGEGSDDEEWQSAVGSNSLEGSSSAEGSLDEEQTMGAERLSSEDEEG